MTKEEFLKKIKNEESHALTHEKALVMMILPVVKEDEELSHFFLGIPSKIEELGVLRALTKESIRSRVRLNGGWRRDLGNLAQQIGVEIDDLEDVLLPLIKEIVREEFGVTMVIEQSAGGTLKS